MSVYRLFDRAYRGHVHDSEVLRNLNIIILAAAVGMLLATAQGGVAFTGYASTLGAGEFAFGLISALPVLASLLQIPVSYLAVKTGKYKRMFMIGGVIQRLTWVVVAFIPYMFPVGQSRIWSLIVLVTLAAMAGSFVVIPSVTLLGSMVPIDIRGRFVAARQKVCTAVSLLFGVGIAFALDYLPGFLGYTLVFTIGGVAGIVEILMYSGINFSGIPDKPEGFSISKGIKDCFKTPKTRNYLLYWTLWFFAIYLNAPFITKYAIDVLSISYTSMIIFGALVSQVMMFITISRWGVFLDRYGSVPLMLIATLSTTAIISVWLFAVPGSVWPVFVFNFLGGIVWSGHDACMVNMQFSHTPSEGRPAALAVYAVFTSIAAGAALILGGAVLELLSPVMERASLTFAGTPFDHYKLVFVIAIILRFTVILVFLPRVWNEKDMTLRESYIKVFHDTSNRLKYTYSRIRIPRRK